MCKSFIQNIIIIIVVLLLAYSKTKQLYEWVTETFTQTIYKKMQIDTTLLFQLGWNCFYTT